MTTTYLQFSLQQGFKKGSIMKTFNSFIRQIIKYIYVIVPVLILLMAGCNSTKETKESVNNAQSTITNISDPAPSDPPDPPDPCSSETNIQAGRKLFSSVGCSACHTINGKGGTVGPDLSNEGNMKHSRSWLTTQIRNPKSHDSKTVMPSYSYLSDSNVAALVDYLEQLKTKQESANINNSNKLTAYKGENNTTQVENSVYSSAAAGGIMWAQKCGQCHNFRPPSEYSDSQWVAAVLHMRLQVPLTGDEQRKILVFLQASN